MQLDCSADTQLLCHELQTMDGAHASGRKKGVSPRFSIAADILQQSLPFLCQLSDPGGLQTSQTLLRALFQADYASTHETELCHEFAQKSHA